MRLFAKVDGTVDRFDRPLSFGEIFDRPWYHIFPTLSRAPVINGTFRERLAFDSTIRSEFESGDVMTRPRYTATKKAWEDPYRYMTDADKADIELLQDNVFVGADKFLWTNRQKNVAYFVRFMGPVDFKLEAGEIDRWRFTLKLVQV